MDMGGDSWRRNCIVRVRVLGSRLAKSFLLIPLAALIHTESPDAKASRGKVLTTLAELADARGFRRGPGPVPWDSGYRICDMRLYILFRSNDFFLYFGLFEVK